MFREPNRKVVGAFVLGFALVAGAYTLTNFGVPNLPQPAASLVASAPTRNPIEVTDQDNNGIEDWRDEFVTAEAIIINQASSTYTPPKTLTGRLGISFVENVIRAKSYGPFGGSQEEVIENTVDALAAETESDLYGVNDISIMETWSETDIKNYANAMAGAIINSDFEPTENELLILDDIINRGKIERMEELKVMSNSYVSIRDASLATPVPDIFAKQHLDLINTYQAIHIDIEAMTLSLSDPAVALLRLKRYEDDALGLKLAMENMYDSLEPYSGLFSDTDPAVFFANFNGQNQP